MTARKKYWFKAKSLGWGWYPSTWQGWAATGLYTFLAIWIVYRVDASAGAALMPLSFLIPFMMLTAGFITLCLRTGEPSKRRAGK